VRLSVSLFGRHAHHDSKGDAASVHFGPTIRRTDIFVSVEFIFGYRITLKVSKG